MESADAHIVPKQKTLLDEERKQIVDINIFNFPQHFKLLKYRLLVTETKKSVSEFQRRYGEFKFQVILFGIEERAFLPFKSLENKQKAASLYEIGRPAVTKILKFPLESKLC